VASICAEAAALHRGRDGNFTVMMLLALFVFKVPLKGSFPRQLGGVLIYVTTMTGYGMLISAFTETQIPALFGTAILTVLPATQFAGMMTPVSSLAGGPGHRPRLSMAYHVPISVGITFTKTLSQADDQTLDHRQQAERSMVTVLSKSPLR
jgi:ribosome-dependent ATPase